MLKMSHTEETIFVTFNFSVTMQWPTKQAFGSD